MVLIELNDRITK